MSERSEEPVPEVKVNLAPSMSARTDAGAPGNHPVLADVISADRKYEQDACTRILSVYLLRLRIRIPNSTSCCKESENCHFSFFISNSKSKWFNPKLQFRLACPQAQGSGGYGDYVNMNECTSAPRDQGIHACSSNNVLAATDGSACGDANAGIVSERMECAHGNNGCEHDRVRPEHEAFKTNALYTNP